MISEQFKRMLILRINDGVNKRVTIIFLVMKLKDMILQLQILVMGINILQIKRPIRIIDSEMLFQARMLQSHVL